MTAVEPTAPRKKLRHDQVDLTTQLGPLTLANPIVTASGCFGNGREINRFFDIADLGAVVVKSITVEPRQGLPTPRMAETAKGMLNAIGLQNPGIDAWLATELPWLNQRQVPVIVSIAGKTAAEYRYLAERLRGQPGIMAIEANISCPNVEDRNIVFACREESTRDAIQQITRVTNLPVFAKLTPDVTDIAAIAETAVEAGATGVSMINTLLGMAIDVESRRPKLAAVTGGLSGPAIKPVAVRAIHQVHRALPDVPIIGMGGVQTVEDVVELMLAGASVVAVGTAMFANPMAARDLLDALPRWCAERDITSTAELRGAVVL
ncbi:MAG TPA: dihydroorotate dehydrogenase [Egibacteraceae bacterium]|nr:dihydroorotate dehydrogenase [Egibacteraceae bacterium]